MSIDVSSFVGGGRREEPQKPPATEARDLKPIQIRCSYCKSWADADAAAKQKYKCLSCGAPLEVKATAERAQDDGDFGAMMRRGLEENKRRRGLGGPPEPPSIRISNE